MRSSDASCPSPGSVARQERKKQQVSGAGRRPEPERALECGGLTQLSFFSLEPAKGNEVELARVIWWLDAAFFVFSLAFEAAIE